MPKASLAVAKQRTNDWRTKFESQVLIYEGEVLNATLSLALLCIRCMAQPVKKLSVKQTRQCMLQIGRTKPG